MEMKIAVKFGGPAPEEANFGGSKHGRGGGGPKNVVALGGVRCGFRFVLNSPEYFTVGIFGEVEEFVGSESPDQGAVHRCDVLEEPILHKKWIGHVVGSQEASSAKEFGARVSVGLVQA